MNGNSEPGKDVLVLRGLRFPKISECWDFSIETSLFVRIVILLRGRYAYTLAGLDELVNPNRLILSGLALDRVYSCFSILTGIEQNRVEPAAGHTDHRSGGCQVSSMTAL